MKKYHGWIYIERSEGYKDHFSTHRTIEGKEPEIRTWGYGAAGAAAAVEYFEATCKLGPVQLEKTPLGLRVFTQEKKVTARPAGPASPAFR